MAEPPQEAPGRLIDGNLLDDPGIGGGEGRCASAPTDVVKCEALLLQETTYPPIEGGDPIAVS